MKLSDPLSQVNGVGPKLTQAFNGLGLVTIKDLLEYYPRRYDDFSHISPINQLKPGLVTVKVRLAHVSTRRVRRGMTITEAIASDASDSLRVIWFNQPYRKDAIRHDVDYFLSGEYKLSHSRFQLINPGMEAVSEFPTNSARIVPIYAQNKFINSRQIRQVIAKVITLASRVQDDLPSSLVKDLGLLSQAETTKTIHFPESANELKQAKTRLGFNELLPLVMASRMNVADRHRQRSLSVTFNEKLARQFVQHLPFSLTDDQRRAIWQIYLDMQKEIPMNRLVEGDVGSGKTVVAAMAAVMAMQNGYKVAFMAPTELLVKQHLATITKLLKPLSMDQLIIRLSAGQTAQQRKEALSKARSTNNALMVGTHSLLSNDLDWDKLALLIIDEQHRFGVDQRRHLQQMTGHTPHFLSITATPIPRTLALTLLADLDLTRLRDRPNPGRKIISRLIPPASVRLAADLIQQELKAKHQIYIVCPHVHAANSANSVELIYEQYKLKYKNYQVGMVHGQMTSKDQARVMQNFLDNKIQILVATTIIEVGVDIPNASVMLIYGPQRFGLAQLHQLRGRVGRGQEDGYCYLMLEDNLPPSTRLREFVRLDDGFKLSELDLKLRGPGMIYGTLQHGKGLNRYLNLDDANINQLTDKATNFLLENEHNLLKCKRLLDRINNVRQLTYLN